MPLDIESKLQDPFCENTKKQKKNLLVFSVVGIAVAKAEIFPSQISALGVKFDQTDAGSLVNLLIGIIVYFLIIFVVCILSEIRSLQMWSINHRNAISEVLEEDPRPTGLYAVTYVSDLKEFAKSENLRKFTIGCIKMVSGRCYVEVILAISIAVVSLLLLVLNKPMELDASTESTKSKIEQGGADQPATAPESKSEGNEEPKPESEGRSQ